MPALPNTSRLIVLLLGLALTGCGFKLADTSALPPTLSRIHLVTSDFNERQRDALRKRLGQAGAEVVEQAASNAVQLRVRLRVTPDIRLVTSASSGKTVERLARSLDFSLMGTDGNLLAPAKTLSQQKDMVLDDDKLLSSAQERRNVIAELETALFEQLVRQLKRN